MILYNVTINIDKNIAAEWLKWMKQVYIPKVLKTGMFTENKIFRLIEEEDNGGITYAVQFFAQSMKQIQEYQIQYAPSLEAEHNDRYADQFVTFRTLLESEDR